MPPMLPPVEAMPVARPRRVRKKWPTAAREGVKSREQPRPQKTPKLRMKCHSSAAGLHQWMCGFSMRRKGLLPVETLKSIRLAPTNTVPVIISHLGPCLSNRGPINKPPQNTTKV